MSLMVTLADLGLTGWPGRGRVVVMEELGQPRQPEVDQSARYREYLRARVISIATLQGFYKTTVGALTMDQVVLAQQIAHNKLIRLGCGDKDASDQTDWLERLAL